MVLLSEYKPSPNVIHLPLEIPIAAALVTGRHFVSPCIVCCAGTAIDDTAGADVYAEQLHKSDSCGCPLPEDGSHRQRLRQQPRAAGI